MLAASAGHAARHVHERPHRPSPLRVLSHGKDSTGAYVRAGIDVPGEHRGDHRRRQPRRRHPPHALGAHLTFVLDSHDAVGKLAATGRQLDAADGHVRPAQLDRLRRQEPRHHAQPGRQTAMTNSVTARACASSGVHDAARVDDLEQRHGAPAEDRHARRAGHRHLRLPRTPSAAPAARATPSACSRSRPSGARAARAAPRW